MRKYIEILLYLIIVKMLIITNLIIKDNYRNVFNTIIKMLRIFPALQVGQESVDYSLRILKGH